MKRILITGGTIFVSKYAAIWFLKKGYEVFVLNRGNHQQVPGVTLIKADRHQLGDCLKDYHFHAVLDITAYDEVDIRDILEGLGSFEDYIFISSSAVYSESLSQPFQEEQQIGKNKVWGDYGLNKIKAEQYLQSKVPKAYILRPPYLYGPMQNLYREAFVFECAVKKRKFYIPQDGKMELQFFYVEDLCKLMKIIMDNHPKYHIMNVGNTEIVDISRFVELCYQAAETELEKVFVTNHCQQRDYFCFYEYSYKLNVERQNQLLPEQKDLLEGLKESYEWYCNYGGSISRKEYMSFIDSHLIDKGTDIVVTQK